MTYSKGLCRCTNAISYKPKRTALNDLFSRYRRGHWFLAELPKTMARHCTPTRSIGKMRIFALSGFCRAFPATADVAIRRFNKAHCLFHQKREIVYQSQKHWLLKWSEPRMGTWTPRSPADPEVVRRRKDQNPKASLFTLEDSSVRRLHRGLVP